MWFFFHTCVSDQLRKFHGDIYHLKCYPHLSWSKKKDIPVNPSVLILYLRAQSSSLSFKHTLWYTSVGRRKFLSSWGLWDRKPVSPFRKPRADPALLRHDRPTSLCCWSQRPRGGGHGGVLRATGRGTSGQVRADTWHSVCSLCLNLTTSGCYPGHRDAEATISTGKHTNWHCESQGFVYKEPEHWQNKTHQADQGNLSDRPQTLRRCTHKIYKRKYWVSVTAVLLVKMSIKYPDWQADVTFREKLTDQ